MKSIQYQKSLIKELMEVKTDTTRIQYQWYLVVSTVEIVSLTQSSRALSCCVKTRQAIKVDVKYWRH